MNVIDGASFSPCQSKAESTTAKPEIATTPSVRAVGHAGGHRPLPLPGGSDIDLFIYCTEAPPANGRRGWFAKLGLDDDQLRIGVLAGGNRGIAGALLLCGVETWLIYFTIDRLWAEIRTTLSGQSLERVDNYFYPVGRLAMFQTMESLYDPDGLFPDVAAAIREYPAELAGYPPCMTSSCGQGTG